VRTTSSPTNAITGSPGMQWGIANTRRTIAANETAYRQIFRTDVVFMGEKRAWVVESRCRADRYKVLDVEIAHTGRENPSLDIRVLHMIRLSPVDGEAGDVCGIVIHNL